MSTGSNTWRSDRVPCGFRHESDAGRQVRDYITVAPDELAEARQLAESLK